ncbi:MAG: transposase [Candidatus Omnitrophica bacterium]|nr:transposase [Candidatus Omnitrophota bacterium]
MTARDRSQVYFGKDHDKKKSYALSQEVLSISSMQIYAWCIMSNHFYFLIQTGSTSLSKSMRRLLTGYAVTLYCMIELRKSLSSLRSDLSRIAN